MADRLEAVGGRLEVSSSTWAGATVSDHVPVGDEERETEVSQASSIDSRVEQASEDPLCSRPDDATSASLQEPQQDLRPDSRSHAVQDFYQRRLGSWLKTGQVCLERLELFL